MIWKEKGMCDVKEQRLLDQKLQIATKKRFSDLELNEIKEKSMGVAKDGCELSLLKKKMLCVKMSVMLCWRILA